MSDEDDDTRPPLTAPGLFGPALREECITGPNPRRDVISGERLEEWLEANRDKQRFATRNAIYKYQQGVNYPREEVIVALCEALVALRNHERPPRPELPHATLARARMLFDERVVGLEGALANLAALHISPMRLRRMVDTQPMNFRLRMPPGPRQSRS